MLDRFGVIVVMMIMCSSLTQSMVISEHNGNRNRNVTETTVMTFNVLCRLCTTEYDWWGKRLKYFDDIFQRHQPDLIGMQELIDKSDVQDILDILPNHSALFFENNIAAYPDSAIFFDNRKFEVIETGEYWLGPFPDLPFSIGWVLSIPRIVVWAKMKSIETKREFVFISTHFDNNSGNKNNSADLFIERSIPFFQQNLPVIAVGDFNIQMDTYPYSTLTKDEFAVYENAFYFTDKIIFERNTDSPIQEACLNNGKQFEICLIDHIFLSGNYKWQVKSWTNDMFKYGDNLKYPSDHRPILTTIYDF